MNDKMVNGKPVYVAIAEKKEDRKARMQFLFNNRRPRTNSPTVSAAISPFVGQNIFYGHAPPAIHPYALQLIPGVRPFGTLSSNVLSNITCPVGSYSGLNYVQPGQSRVPMHVGVDLAETPPTLKSDVCVWIANVVDVRVGDRRAN
ncbi:hypothetical protein MIMGU_mgv1a026076mg [Erythranthe guttata]|uniref:Uncharacterized protein n=1 Tax=Erythranthe guttata TaxID=4155 RepID=A0A022R3K9_ERYGU|nr:hypothetical protein MIMGU_mgv1a026076mg [Erythranthe guttata]